MNEQELREKASAAFKAGCALREKCKDRVATVEERTAIDKAFDEAEGYAKQADQARRESGLKAALEEVVSRTPHGSLAEPVAPELKARRAAFFKAMQRGVQELAPEEKKALSSLSDSEGQLLLDEQVLPGILSKLRDIVKFRQYATVVQTNAASVGFVTEDFDPDVPVTGEGKTSTTEDVTNWLGKTNLTPHKRSRIFLMPEELLADSTFDFERFWLNRFAVRLGELEEADYMVGSGKGKPYGLCTAPLTTRNATGSAGAAIASDDLINVQGDVKEQYQAGAAWLFKRSTHTAVRLLKDGQNNYLWQPNYQAGGPSTLLGKPVIVSEFMPTPTNGDATKPFLVYGDLSWYMIAERQAMQAQRLVELYAAQGKIGIRITRRLDGAPTLKDPFIKLLKVA